MAPEKRLWLLQTRIFQKSCTLLIEKNTNNKFYVPRVANLRLVA